MRTKEYTGIDLFRLSAAFLMVAIHTSPLADVSETGDFILTRVLARVGVPFFFMTSGFFLISRDVCHMKRLWDLKKRRWSSMVRRFCSIFRSMCIRDIFRRSISCRLC